jgi:predicted nuclease of restriction endonuclease-like (RecB) superfamily
MNDELVLYRPFLEEILEKIHVARYKMLRNVSTETMNLYWNIGKSVSEKVKNEKWGISIVEKLSKDLQSEFPGIRGFSARNIWRMKTLYENYENKSILTPLVAEIGWVHNCIIIEKCKDDKEIEFYLRLTKERGWSKNDLIEKIASNYFYNFVLSQNNFEISVPENIKAKVAWEFVDDYNIELINPDLPIIEKELENSIVSNIVKFLQDMGGFFAFVGRQFRIEYNEKEYFIDLLFFNISLNCYVVFELKARDFDPKDLGQLQMYMMLVNENVKSKHHNPSIGIIVCRGKDRTIVEYLLAENKQPMGVATFNQYKNLPTIYAKYLPNEEEIIKRLSAINDKE